MKIDLISNGNKRDLLHHLLVHLHQRTKMSTIVRLSKLNLLILRVVWHKGVVSLLHMLSGKGTTRGRVVMAPLVALSVVERSFYARVSEKQAGMVMGAIEPSLV